MSAKDQITLGDGGLNSSHQVPQDERVRETQHMQKFFQSVYGDGQNSSQVPQDERVRDIQKIQHLFQGAYGDDQSVQAYMGPRIPGDQVRPMPLYPEGGVFEIPKDPFEKFPNWGDFQKPTDKEETTAEGKLDKQIGGLISKHDQQNLKDINHAILTGDENALAATLAKYKNDPEKLKAVVDEVNRELKDSHAGVGLHMSAEGKVYAYRDDGQRAVEMDPQTGKVTGVRKIMVGAEGDVYIGDVDKNGNPDKVMEHVADRAVSQINNPYGDFDKDWLTKILKHHGHHGGFNPVLLDAGADPVAGTDLSPRTVLL